MWLNVVVGVVVVVVVVEISYYTYYNYYNKTGKGFSPPPSARVLSTRAPGGMQVQPVVRNDLHVGYVYASCPTTRGEGAPALLPCWQAPPVYPLGVSNFTAFL